MKIRSALTRAIRPALVSSIAIATVALPQQTAFADESGVSFWLPGFFGSLAAVPQTPGWSLGVVDYHSSVGAPAALQQQKKFRSAFSGPSAAIH